MHYSAIVGRASAWMHLQIPERGVGIRSLQIVWADRGPTLTVGDKEIGHGWSLFPHIFHGERSELREKYGLGLLGLSRTPSGPNREGD